MAPMKAQTVLIMKEAAVIVRPKPVQLEGFLVIVVRTDTIM